MTGIYMIRAMGVYSLKRGGVFGDIYVKKNTSYNDR